MWSSTARERGRITAAVANSTFHRSPDSAKNGELTIFCREGPYLICRATAQESTLPASLPLGRVDLSSRRARSAPATCSDRLKCGFLGATPMYWVYGPEQGGKGGFVDVKA